MLIFKHCVHKYKKYLVLEQLKIYRSPSAPNKGPPAGPTSLPQISKFLRNFHLEFDSLDSVLQFTWRASKSKWKWRGERKFWIVWTLWMLVPSFVFSFQTQGRQKSKFESPLGVVPFEASLRCFQSSGHRECCWSAGSNSSFSAAVPLAV